MKRGKYVRFDGGNPSVTGIAEKKREFYLKDFPDIFLQGTVVLPEPAKGAIKAVERLYG